MLILLLIIVSLVIIALIGVVVYNVIDKNYNYATLVSCIIGILSILLGVLIYGFNQPHHGMEPELKDVPTEAHIDTVKTIVGNDTTITFKIEWNYLMMGD